MTMQRRHFELIAEIIKDEREAAARGVVLTPVEAGDQMAQAFARRLRATNPNFKEARFLRACGVTDA